MTFEKVLMGEYPLFTCTSVFRKELISQIDATEKRRFLSGDTFLWLEFSRLTKFKHLEESTAVRQVLPESASHSRSVQRQIAFRQSGYDLALHMMKMYGCSEDVAKVVHGKFNRSLLILALRASDRPLAKRSYENLVVLSREEFLPFYLKILYGFPYLPFSARALNWLRSSVKEMFANE